MNETSSIFSLSPELLCYIGRFLTPKDLLALSGSCHYLRAVYNTSSLWRRYTDKRFLNMTLDSTTSVVLPKYCELQSSTLEPLCKHRASFLKQSRLVSNIRQNNFVRHATPFKGYFSDLEKQVSLNSKIIYNDVYLFVIDYSESSVPHEVVKVFNIEEAPYLTATFEIETHNPNNYMLFIWLQVVGNKLVVCTDDWFDIYQIKLPIKEFPILCSVQYSEFGTFMVNRPIILGHLLFVENCTLNVIHVWNVDDGKKLDDICPRNHGPEFCILGHSKDFKYVILSSCISVHLPHVFVYDVESMQYTSFRAVLSENLKMYETYGFMDAHRVVLVSRAENLMGYIFVYCYSTSALLAKKEFEIAGSLDGCNIVGNYFLLPTVCRVLIMNITTLDTIASLEIEPDNFEFPQNTLLTVGYIDVVSHLQHIIVMIKTDGAEVWDFEKRVKLMACVQKRITVNDTHSKLIVCGKNILNVFNFW